MSKLSELMIENRQLRERNAALESVLKLTYAELNEIHARDGVPWTHQGIPSSVAQEYFTSVVEQARAALTGGK